jgi:hypothetical protein
VACAAAFTCFLLQMKSSRPIRMEFGAVGKTLTKNTAR